MKNQTETDTKVVKILPNNKSTFAPDEQWNWTRTSFICGLRRAWRGVGKGGGWGLQDLDIADRRWQKQCKWKVFVVAIVVDGGLQSLSSAEVQILSASRHRRRRVKGVAGIWVRRDLVRWCVPEGDAGEKEVGESNLEAVYIQKRAAKLTQNWPQPQQKQTKRRRRRRSTIRKQLQEGCAWCSTKKLKLK